MSSFSKWFWDESFWLPVNYTWKDFTPTEHVPKPQFSDLYIVPALVALMLFVRYLFELFIALPICMYGIGDGLKRTIEENAVCEEVYICLFIMFYIYFYIYLTSYEKVHVTRKNTIRPLFPLKYVCHVKIKAFLMVKK